MPNLVAQVKRAKNNGQTALVADLYDAKFCTPAETVSLLHFDDPDNPYKDECGNIWIRNADQAGVVIDTSTAVFGSGCLRLIQKSPQSVPYVLNPVYLGGRDFTIDFWFKGEICFWFSSNNNDSLPRVVINIEKLFYNTTSAASLSMTATAKNSWRHFALVYNYASNIGTCYINGSRVVAKTFSSPKLERQACRIFPYCFGPSSYPPRVDEFRVVDGLQVWTSNFTPPTQPYKLVDGHIPCRLQGSTQRLWAPFNFIKTDLTPAEDTDTTVADSDTT